MWSATQRGAIRVARETSNLSPASHCKQTDRSSRRRFSTNLWHSFDRHTVMDDDRANELYLGLTDEKGEIQSRAAGWIFGAPRSFGCIIGTRLPEGMYEVPKGVILRSELWALPLSMQSSIPLWKNPGPVGQDWRWTMSGHADWHHSASCSVSPTTTPVLSWPDTSLPVWQASATTLRSKSCLTRGSYWTRMVHMTPKSTARSSDGDSSAR